MRILHVLGQRGFSGGEHQLLHVLGHLRRRGVESILAVNPGARFAGPARRLGLDVREVPMRNDADVRASLRLRRLFHVLAPDLIHLACSRSHKLGAHASIAWRDCPPRVVTRRMDYRLARTHYRRWLYGRAVSAVVAVSEGVRAEILGIGVDPARVHLIRDGVDVPELARWSAAARRAAARRDLGLDPATLLGVTSASLHRRKGQDVLLEALGRVQLPAGKSRLVWILAGDGPSRAGLAALAAGAGTHIEVRFAGHVDHVEPLLAAADVFCLPSRKEGLGVALLEAMAVGLPVIGSAVGGIQEAVVAGETGLLVPPEDPDALAAGLTRLLGDPDLARRLGAAARRRVAEGFSVDKMCRETERLYVELALAGAGSRQSSGNP